jgi:hypothetical protein
MSSYAEAQQLANTRDAEEARVAEWRLEQFSALGFTPTEALLLAVSAADLHEARALLAAGCTRPLALRILL